MAALPGATQTESQRKQYDASHKKVSINTKQQFIVEKVHLIYTYLCEHIVPDQNGDPVCLYDLEFPGDCQADNCPFLKGVLNNERSC